ncbi:hypothetical protein Aab01nite_10420 [Paractinoplanes abujensis]|uniref:Secreted protein n=1 Tax=Paractinoplanes abujensis TaxID=882441 RepID=A0A7W7G016_9ACTN|nr:hypothetical protein [Actinoplanes abujensis]MBB4691134.1 hypothetical protein [Actinoplanes abujensis]GID17452.1 hypothetical protein Aab01nite_10420 [Actinoplanes abujensis]
MDRRAFLATGGAAAVAAVTGSAAAAAVTGSAAAARAGSAAGADLSGAAAGAAGSEATAQAAARWPIFEWARPTGFFFPGGLVLPPPPLAVYEDGTAYADATASLPLHHRAAESLRAHAVAVLRSRRFPALPPPGPGFVTRPDRLRVRDDDGTVLAAELTGRDPAVRELAAHVQELRRTVLGGEPWRPNAVLLAAARLDVEPVGARPWPSGIPVPADRELRLRGARAQAVREKLEIGSRAYRVSPMHHVAATWRHLLPHE